MSPRRVLLCGTNYGLNYARALAGAADRYTLVGVLARGSERSRQAADRLHLPLLRHAADVPAGVDLACAALGMEAHGVVLQLLAQGISVLCEHPLPAEKIRASVQAARTSGARFHLNGHWYGMEASQKFIEFAAERRQREAPVHIQIAATDRALYGVLDILARALPRVDPVSLEPAGRDGPFCLLRGRLGDCAATLRLEASPRGPASTLPDGSPAYLNCYRVILQYPAGALSLLSPGGPVIWNANENRTQDDPDLPLWAAVYDGRVSGRSLGRQRLNQNLRAVDDLAAELDGRCTQSHQQPDFLLQVSESWERLGELLARSLRDRSGP